MGVGLTAIETSNLQIKDNLQRVTLQFLCNDFHGDNAQVDHHKRDYILNWREYLSWIQVAIKC